MSNEKLTAEQIFSEFVALKEENERLMEGLRQIPRLDDIPDSFVSDLFEQATGRKYSSRETCVNDFRRILMLFWNRRVVDVLHPQGGDDE